MYGTSTFLFNSNNYNQISRLTHISFKQMQAKANEPTPPQQCIFGLLVSLLPLATSHIFNTY